MIHYALLVKEDDVNLENLENTMSETQAQPQINLLRMYLKGASLEHPAAPFAFLDDSGTPVQDKLDLQVNVNVVAEGLFEVAVRATLTLSRDNKAMLVLEGEQAGLFQLTDVPAEDIDGVLGVNAAAMVYGYLRVNFADLMTRATLPPVHLPEINWLEQHQARVAQMVAAQGRPAAANESMH